MRRILLALSLSTTFLGFAQPTAPGISPYEVLDTDDDGILPFDMVYYVESIYKPRIASFGNDLSGYDFAFSRFGVAVTSPYTNVENPDDIQVDWTYNGNGPIYNPNNTPGGGLFFSDFPKLLAVPASGDFDNDGVLNGDEDPNGNGVVSDDNTDGEGAFDYRDPDDDGDGIPTFNEDYNGNGNRFDDDLNGNGIPDFRDAEVALAVEDVRLNQFIVYPNPAHGVFTVSFPQAEQGATLRMFDVSGKLVKTVDDFTGSVEISGIEPGVYLLKFDSENRSLVRKLIIM